MNNISDFILARIGELYCELTAQQRTNQELQAKVAELTPKPAQEPSGEASGAV